MPSPSTTYSKLANVCLLGDVETHEDVIIVNKEIARALETGELEMPFYGNIKKSERED